jgi:hypothetical protein
LETNQIVTAAGTQGLITGVFYEHTSAELAYNALTERGYAQDEINLVMSDETRSRYFPLQQLPVATSEAVVAVDAPASAVKNAAVGSAIGGTVGAIIGIVAAIGTSIVVPGLGLILAGPIAAGLAGAGAGVVTGGMIGVLQGAGIPENEAKIYESGISKGNIIMSFRPHNSADSAYFAENWPAKTLNA